MADIVERLRAITGQAGDHGDVQLCDEAADEIERLRAERRWIPVSERLPPEETLVMAYDGEDVFESKLWDGRWDWELDADVSHWIALPEPPSR